MRLSTAQIEAIKQEPRHFFGAQVEVWLFGSRVDDKAKGGVKLSAQRGFTLVELITVMVIIGILAVAVLPRFFTVSDFEDRGSADQVESMLRFAQKTAIAQHRNISVTFSTAATPNCTTTLTGVALTCQVKSNVATKTVIFDALGRPVDAGGVPLTANDTLTVGGTTITTISIEAETGYVH